MVVSWSNMAGLAFDIAGIVCIGIFSHKSPGTFLPATITRNPHAWWLETGIFLVALGVTVHVLGYIAFR